MWAQFDGKAYTQDEFRALIASLKFDQGWRPTGITLHNTGAPNLKQWAESGPAHDARIRGLQAYYEQQLGWHAGPHLFISRQFINGFSNIQRIGVHASCFNNTRIGIEMVGDFEPNDDQFNSGDGAMVRDNAVFAVAVLNMKLGLKPEDMNFHRDCVQDHHACPGSLVDRTTFINLVKVKMVELGDTPIATPVPAGPALVTPINSTKMYVQIDGLNLRSGSSAQSFITAVLNKGEIVSVIGSALNAGTKWSKVQTSKGDGYVAERFLSADQGKPQSWQLDIMATCFGGAQGAYGPLNDSGLEVALPFRFEGGRPDVEVKYSTKLVRCKINDVGPWNIRDAYWETNARPQAEMQHETKTRAQDGKVPSNWAGIDLTPGVWHALGVDPSIGRIMVDWRFAT